MRLYALSALLELPSATTLVRKTALEDTVGPYSFSEEGHYYYLLKKYSRSAEHMPTLSLQAHSHPDIGIAWMRALTVQYTGMSLVEIRRIDVDLLPAFLAQQYDKLQVIHVVLAVRL
jgi:hypothetical protein